MKNRVSEDISGRVGDLENLINPNFTRTRIDNLEQQIKELKLQMKFVGELCFTTTMLVGLLTLALILTKVL